jgi:hypothetical protein
MSLYLQFEVVKNDGFPVDVIEDKNALDKMLRALLSEKPDDDLDS